MFIGTKTSWRKQCTVIPRWRLCLARQICRGRQDLQKDWSAVKSVEYVYRSSNVRPGQSMTRDCTDLVQTLCWLCSYICLQSIRTIFTQQLVRPWRISFSNVQSVSMCFTVVKYAVSVNSLNATNLGVTHYNEPCNHCLLTYLAFMIAYLSSSEHCYLSACILVVHLFFFYYTSFLQFVANKIT